MPRKTVHCVLKIVHDNISICNFEWGHDITSVVVLLKNPAKGGIPAVIQYTLCFDLLLLLTYRVIDRVVLEIIGGGDGRFVQTVSNLNDPPHNH